MTANENFEVGSDNTQFLTLYMGEQKFGVPILKIQDVLHSQKLTSVPMSETYIEGVMNLRGRIVTAINLRKRIKGNIFSDSSAAAEDKVVKKTRDKEDINVVIESNTELYSILVDDVDEVITLNSKQIEDAPLTLSTSWRQVIQGVYQTGKEIILLLDIDKIIYSEAA